MKTNQKKTNQKNTKKENIKREGKRDSHPKQDYKPRGRAQRIEIPEGVEIICGRNPVEELIKSGREIDTLYVQRGSNSSAEAIAHKAKKQGVRVQYVDRRALDEASEGIPHQGILCTTSPFEYADLDEMLDSTAGRIPLLILLDGIEDPHNLGAIIRTAECVGASGVIIPKRHSASINQTVAKSSAGAVEYMPCARVSNIAATIDKLKEHGFWIYACDMDGENLFDAKIEGKVAIVIGNEGAGVSRLVKEKCDFALSIPMRGNIDSLNASNAAALVMYEVFRKQMTTG